MNLKKFQQWAAKIKGEVARSLDGSLILVVPNPVDPQDVKENTPSDMPPITVQVGPKPSTLERLDNLMKSRAAASQFSGVIGSCQYNGRHLNLIVSKGIQDIETIWEDVCTTLEEDGFLESWKLGDELYYSKTLPKALSENRMAKHAVDAIDCALLSKALDKAQTIDDILAAI